MEVDIQSFRDHSIQAVRMASGVIRQFQLRERITGDISRKPEDETLVTIADRESGELIRSYMSGVFPEVAQSIEDTGEITCQSQYVILCDPLDGTRPFANGSSTSAVVLSLYDNSIHEIVSCVIAEPATGRLWYTEKSSQTIYTRDQGDVGSICHVWNGKYGMQSTVCIDPAHRFIKKSSEGVKQVLTDEQVGELLQGLWHDSHILLLGSNAIHQALVAHGGDFMTGAITTAIGGPWDVCGALLVLNAGGSARAFTVSKQKKIIDKNPLDVLSYDLLVVGNSNDTVNILYRKLASLF